MIENQIELAGFPSGSVNDARIDSSVQLIRLDIHPIDLMLLYFFVFSHKQCFFAVR